MSYEVRNLYDPSASISGYVGDVGQISPGDSTKQERISDYIPMANGQTLYATVYVTIGAKGYPWVGYAFYGSDKSAIKNSRSSLHKFELGTGKHVFTDIITCNYDDAAYMRYSTRTYGNARVMISTAPAAWAPAEGETLAGVGALMSANLWDTSTENFKPDANGVYLVGKSTGELKCTITGASAIAENQTVHMGASLRGSGKGALKPFVEYKDAAGNVNWVGFPAWTPTDQWQRFEGSCVVPSGMTPTYFGFNTSKATGDMEMLNPAFSYGSPVTLASSAHTPYATQDHVAAEYATKAALKVTSDAVTAEVEERGKLAGKVGTLESTTGTHTSKLEQLASSIKSLVKGESTYTDPDGRSATSGIYSLVTQTRDAVTALFGSYTKTADLASTQAVKDAKKAGTDAASAAATAQSTADTAKANAATAQTTADSAKSTAQAAASDAATAKTNAASAVSTANSASTSAANAVNTANAASSTASSANSTANSAASTANAAKTSAASAVSTANSANSTAGAAKSAADSLATMIREDATGITVGKSADGKTWSTGRTRMTDSAFEVLDKAGATVAQLASDGVSFLAGLVRIVAGKATLPGNLTVNSITIDSGGGVAVLRGIVSRISANLNGVTSSVSAGWEQNFGHGVTAIVRESAHLESAKMVPERMASAHLASDKAELYVGDNSMKVTGDSFSLSHPEYLRKGLRITQGSKVCHGHGTPWVTLFESWSEFQSATGCYDSGTPTLVTMNGDWKAFDAALSDCEIKGGEAVYVMARTTDGPYTLYSNDSVRINWICIW